jgi:hypothetical protein
MKSLLLLPLVLMAVMFSSCTKKTEYVQPNRTIYATLLASAWKFDSSTNTYYNEIAMPEIDDRVNQTNGVLAYITYDNKVYEAIPDVLDGSTYIYRYEVGLLTVEIQNADGSTTGLTPPTQDIGIKIVLVESNAE